VFKQEERAVRRPVEAVDTLFLSQRGSRGAPAVTRAGIGNSCFEETQWLTKGLREGSREKGKGQGQNPVLPSTQS
jgi:hypothetical protein